MKKFTICPDVFADCLSGKQIGRLNLLLRFLEVVCIILVVRIIATDVYPFFVIFFFLMGVWLFVTVYLFALCRIKYDVRKYYLVQPVQPVRQKNREDYIRRIRNLDISKWSNYVTHEQIEQRLPKKVKYPTYANCFAIFYIGFVRYPIFSLPFILFVLLWVLAVILLFIYDFTGWYIDIWSWQNIPALFPYVWDTNDVLKYYDNYRFANTIYIVMHYGIFFVVTPILVIGCCFCSYTYWNLIKSRSMHVLYDFLLGYNFPGNKIPLGMTYKIKRVFILLWLILFCMGMIWAYYAGIVTFGSKILDIFDQITSAVSYGPYQVLKNTINYMTCIFFIMAVFYMLPIQFLHLFYVNNIFKEK